MENSNPLVKYFDYRDQLLWFNVSIVIVKTNGLQKIILYEAHLSPLYNYPRGIKMRENLIKLFYFYGMKNKFNEFVTRYFECQKMKIEYQHVNGMSNPYDVPM